MATDFHETELWLTTLGASFQGPQEAARAKLAAAYEQFRSVVERLAEDIKISMPMFTDHGIEHVDSLWDTASLLTTGSIYFNPAEAFVLGGAFLLHDLGMGLVAYPNGAESIEADPLFNDLVALARSDKE